MTARSTQPQQRTTQTRTTQTTARTPVIRTTTYDDSALRGEIAAIREQMETDSETLAGMNRQSERDLAAIRGQMESDSEALAAIREQMESDAEAIADMTRQAEQNLAAIRDITDSLGEQKEYTHEVGVQIYRNVQAALIDELAKQSADREDHCKLMQEKMEELPGKMQEKKTTSPLLVITFLITLGNLALLLWICYLNGYFGM